MKSLIVLASLIVTSAVSAASKDNPSYTQCIVDLPGGTIAGICKDTGEKHYTVISCEGRIQAHVEPGAMSRRDVPTCGANYLGYEEAIKIAKG